LGQTPNAAGNPGRLLSDREIPMFDFDILLADGAQATPFKNRFIAGSVNTMVFDQFSKICGLINSPDQLQTGVLGAADSYLTPINIPLYNPYSFTNQSNRVKIGVLGVGNQSANSPYLAQHIVGVEGVAYNLNPLPSNNNVNSISGVLARAYSNNTNVTVAGIGVFAGGAANVVGCGVSARGGTNVFGGRFIAQFGSVSNIGVFAIGATNVGPISPPSYPSNVNIGVYGASDPVVSPLGTIVRYAGYFDGDVFINGTQGGLPGFALTASDSAFKQQVDTIANARSIIAKLKPRHYFMDTTNSYKINFSSKKQYGFIAQDVQKILPEMVSSITKPAMVDSTGAIVTPSVTYKGLNYGALFAILTAAMQEQQSKMDSLIKRDSIHTAQLAQLVAAVNSLSSAVTACCSNSSIRSTGINGTTLNPTTVELSDANVIVLNQNVPNPFAEQTTITYTIPEQFGFAQIIFKTLEGKLIKAVDITTKGKGQLNVFANDLSKGIYVYTLVVDGKAIDTKKMVKE
jgi:hypothetical protein